MKLGILVNSDLHVDDIVGITKSASSKGHEVMIFATDVGTKLLENKKFTGLCRLSGVKMNFCDHSADHLNVNLSGVPEIISKGSQYNNAIMNHDSDRVIVL